jgi:hypothetical protein
MEEVDIIVCDKVVGVYMGIMEIDDFINKIVEVPHGLVFPKRNEMMPM